MAACEADEARESETTGLDTDGGGCGMAGKEAGVIEELSVAAPFVVGGRAVAGVLATLPVTTFLRSTGGGDPARGDVGDMSSTSGGWLGERELAEGTRSSRATFLELKLERVRWTGKIWPSGAGDGALSDSSSEGDSGLGHWKS